MNNYEEKKFLQWLYSNLYILLVENWIPWLWVKISLRLGISVTDRDIYSPISIKINIIILMWLLYIDRNNTANPTSIKTNLMWVDIKQISPKQVLNIMHIKAIWSK